MRILSQPQLQRIKPQAEPDFRTLTGDETDTRRKVPKIQHGRCELREIWASSELTPYLNAEFDWASWVPAAAEKLRFCACSLGLKLRLNVKFD